MKGLESEWRSASRRLIDRNAECLGGGFEGGVQFGNGHALPYGDFEVGGIVHGQDFASHRPGSRLVKGGSERRGAARIPILSV